MRRQVPSCVTFIHRDWSSAQAPGRVRVTVTVTAPGLPGPSQARLAADRETPNPETWPVWPQGHPKHTATLACHGSASGPGRPPGPGPFKFKLTPSPSRRCPFWPSQAEVTINNNKLEEHLLVWAASLGANDKASSKSSLKLYYLVIFGHGCVVFYHCPMSAANRA
jgi:hypothetical protein